MDYQITNIVTTGNLGVPLDLKNLELVSIAKSRIRKKRTVKKPFAGLFSWRTKEFTTLLYPNGKFVLNRVRGLTQMENSIRTLETTLKEKGYRVMVRDVQIRNIAAACDWGKPIDLRRLARFKGFSYEPELFCGVVYKNEKKTCLVFHTGKIILTGCTCEPELSELHRWLMSILTQH